MGKNSLFMLPKYASGDMEKLGKMIGFLLPNPDGYVILVENTKNAQCRGRSSYYRKRSMSNELLSCN